MRTSSRFLVRYYGWVLTSCAMPSGRALPCTGSFSFQVQTAYTALSNGGYGIEERLARWLLMYDDRLDGNELPLTHEFLGIMLGVRRSSVTLTIQMLESAQVIAARRGRLILLDRAKLEVVAGDSYGTPEAEYERLIAGAAMPVTSGLRPRAIPRKNTLTAGT